MRKKTKIVVGALIGLFLICAGVYFLVTKKTKYTESIGGWSDFKSQVELKFSENEDIKKAALQVAEALQEAVDYPENAKEIVISL